MKYTFSFSGEVAVIAPNINEAYQMAGELTQPSIYASDHCENISVDDIELTDMEDEEEE